MPRRIGLELLAVGIPALVALLGTPAFGWSLATGLLACAVLPLRHRWPAAALLGVLPGLAGGLGWAPALVALYAIGRRARSLPDVAPWLALPLVATVAPVFLTQDLRWQQQVLTVGFVAVNVVAPVVVGLLVGTRARLVQSLVELDRARESAVTARSDAARAEERARIGREIHDAVGHHITLIAVGAAALSARTEEDHTRAAADELRTLAKRSLGEVRTALGLAGNPVDTAADESAVIGDVGRLVADWRCAGLSVELREDGRAATPDPAIGRAAYRVVQESLTNAARHAAGAPVRVEVLCSAAVLDVRIDNDPVVARSGPAEIWGGGMGLVGLAERVDALGGRFRAGPRRDGGFTVEARFPLASLPASTHQSRLGGATSDGGVSAARTAG